MQRAVAFLVLLGFSTGCHSKRARYVGAGVSIAAGVGALAIAPARERCVYSDDLLDFSGELCEIGQDLRAMLLFTGVAMILGGLITIGVVSTPPSVASSHDESLDEKIVIRLTAQAALAARNGDCPAVRALVDRIARRDATVVIDDPAIGRCLP